MDPNANLREQREITAAILALWDGATEDTDHERALAAHAARLAELVQALDEWIAGGGFLPDTWANASARARAKDIDLLTKVRNVIAANRNAATTHDAARAFADISLMLTGEAKIL